MLLWDAAEAFVDSSSSNSNSNSGNGKKRKVADEDEDEDDSKDEKKSSFELVRFSQFERPNRSPTLAMSAGPGYSARGSLAVRVGGLLAGSAGAVFGFVGSHHSPLGRQDTPARQHHGLS